MGLGSAMAIDEKWFFHWAMNDWGLEVMMPSMRSLSPKEGWFDGTLKCFGLSSLKNCSLLNQADLSLLAWHRLAQFLLSRLRVFFSNKELCLGRPASHHFVHAALHLVLRCCSGGLWIKHFLGFLGLKWGMEYEAMLMMLSETDLTSSFSSKGEV